MDPIKSLFTEDTVLDIPSTDSLFRIPFDPSNLHCPLTPTQLQILQNDDELCMLVDQTPINTLLLKHGINHDNFQISPPPAKSSSSPIELLLGAAEGDTGGGSGGEQINNNQADRIVNLRDLGGVEEKNFQLGTKNMKRLKSKVVHREIERKRRKEMASLQHSLRSHLPSEYLKGKRSISDQLNEAVKYIRHLQERTQALKHKRDEMRRTTPQQNNPSSSPYTSNALIPQDHSHHQIRNIVGDDDQCYGLRSNAEMEIDPATVSVSSWTTAGGGGTIIEVMVKSCISGETWALSKVIQTLERQGVEVVCSTSNKVDNKWLHFLRAQVGGCNVDPPELQQNLIAEISQFHTF